MQEVQRRRSLDGELFPSSISPPPPPFDSLTQPSEISITSKPPSFTHPACPHVTRCLNCENLQPHRNCIIVAVDGACRGNGNGQTNTRSATGICFGADSRYNLGLVMSAADVKTNQVAELHVGIEALRTVINLVQGMDRQVEEVQLEQVVLKSDSEYLVKGVTEWVDKWERNGWRTAKGGPVVNERLFNEVRGLIKELAGLGVEVLFWHVRREENSEADRLANGALDGR
ncbi:ribonuclease H-like protein [Cadophora sp. DSE1049]|nr:ribonuclease H-like protein [Cadophora sp. DSE1049]